MMRSVLRFTGLCRKQFVQSQRKDRLLSAGIPFSNNGVCFDQGTRGIKDYSGRNDTVYLLKDHGIKQSDRFKKHMLYAVPEDKVGLVIGKGGENIKKIIASSGANIFLPKENNPSKNETAFVQKENNTSKNETAFSIRGQPAQVLLAINMIRETLGEPVLPEKVVLGSRGLNGLTTKEVKEDSSMPADASDVFQAIVNLCKSDQNKWSAGIKVAQLSLLPIEKPLVFSPKVENVLRIYLKKHPLDEQGMSLLKFVLKHGEKDSKFEREVLESLLQNCVKYNGLGLASIVDNIPLVNTDHRWTVVDEFTEVIKGGLMMESVHFIVKSLNRYHGSVLFPYLVNHIFRLAYLKSTSFANIGATFHFMYERRINDFTLFKRMEFRIAKMNMKSRMDPNLVKNLLSLVVLTEGSISYVKTITFHLQYNLSLIQERSDAHPKSCSIFTACLVSYAMRGFHNEDVVDKIIEKVELLSVKDTADLMKVVNALSMLNHKDVEHFKDRVSEILTSQTEDFLKKMTSKDIRTVVEQQWLGAEQLQWLMARQVGQIEKRLSDAADLTYDDVAIYFLLKAYSEIDLKIPVKDSLDEEVLLKALSPLDDNTNPLRRSLEFVAGLLVGEERLMRSNFTNKYGHFIDVEFYLDKEGHPHSADHNADLTRFVVLLLLPNDTVYRIKGEKEWIESRGSTKHKIHQLSKFENTEVIQVYYNKWESLGDRNFRKSYLQDEIDQRLKKRRTETANS